MHFQTWTNAVRRSFTIVTSVPLAQTLSAALNANAKTDSGTLG